ncbi:MAG: hypothetical protein IJS88_04730 [Alphaproteobacteria bacterium]|nr:hypothetical protein [Alphaproteobacteria bacterium]
MKKIFIPALTLLLTGLASSASAQCYDGNCTAPVFTNPCSTAMGCPEEEKALFEDFFDNQGSDSYWKNRFRQYRIYPIVEYPEAAPCDEAGMDSEQTVNAHEYQRGVVVSANKGQRMYDSTTYTLRTHTSTFEAYRVNTKGYIRGKGHEFKLYTDELLRPVGEVSINNAPYMLISLGNTPYMVMIDNKGRFYNQIGIANNGNLYVGNDTVVINPPSLRLIPAQSIQQSKSDTRLNFDIRYDGIENNMLVFLVYNADTGTTTKRTASPTQRYITVNGINFEIIYYTPEYIEYRIN